MRNAISAPRNVDHKRPLVNGPGVRLLYPLHWSRLGRRADQEQSVATAAALARRGAEVTLLMPRGRDDPRLDEDELRAWFGVDGPLRLVQRPSAHAGPSLVRTALWLRQVFADPELAAADLLYSRLPAMLVAGQLSPIPFATDHYRPWPDDWPLLRPLIRRTARHARCLGLVLHSEFAGDSYRRAGVPPGKLLVAHNGADGARRGTPRSKAEARARLGLAPGRPLAVYAGRLDVRKGLDQLLALAERRPGVDFLLVGSEGEGPIERTARRLANVRVEPWQAPDALAPFLAAADLLVIPAASAPLERHSHCVLPMKTFAYLAAGRPIVAPVSPDTAELLTDGENALLVPPDRPEAAAAALDRLLADPALAARLGENAARQAESLTWDHRAGKIAAFLEARLSGQDSE
jgi:glycosyltransferase involved in cell wall biosynthesis